MEVYRQLTDIITEDNIYRDEPMSRHTTFRVGGNADYFVTPADNKQLAALVSLCETEGIRYVLHGNGSNMLYSDKGFKGVVICIGNNMAEVKVKGNTITAGAGVLLARIAMVAAENSLSGIEFASGIPGTLGGAVAMNAGAYGGEMKDVITEVTVCDRQGNIFNLISEELEFGYRTSIIQKDKLIVLSATVELKEGNREEIKAVMKELNNRRRDKQPLEYGSAGSTFKRPEGYFAGQLIEESKLKGYRVGDAMVSDKHAGFVVNVGNATYADVMAVITHVKEVIRQNYGIELETEVKIIE